MSELRSVRHLNKQPAPKKFNYVGAPAMFKLTQACQQINDAFGHFGCYLCGSALEGPNWRDVDVRYVMPDEDFNKLFPDATEEGWEFDPRWLLLTVAISGWLKEQTGLPVDFQFQRQSHVGKRHSRHQGKSRQPVGLRMAKPESGERT